MGEVVDVADMPATTAKLPIIRNIGKHRNRRVGEELHGFVAEHRQCRFEPRNTMQADQAEQTHDDGQRHVEDQHHPQQCDEDAGEQQGLASAERRQSIERA